jgi:hypothetical protein
MKKALFVIITLMMIGLTSVSAQDMAGMEREFNQVADDMSAGRITPVQAQQKIMEIQQKYMGFGDATVGGSAGRASTSGSDAGQAHNRRMAEQATQMPSWLQAEQQQAQEEEAPAGSNEGWPSASVFRQFSLPNLRQPAETTVSYNTTNTGNLVIYIRNATQTTLDQLAREIDSGTNGQGTKWDGGYSRGLPMPSGLKGYNSFRVELELRNGGVILQTIASAG